MDYDKGGGQGIKRGESPGVYSWLALSRRKNLPERRYTLSRLNRYTFSTLDAFLSGVFGTEVLHDRV